MLSEVDQKKSVKEQQETTEVKTGQLKKAPPPPKKVVHNLCHKIEMLHNIKIEKIS